MRKLNDPRLLLSLLKQAQSVIQFSLEDLQLAAKDHLAEPALSLDPLERNRKISDRRVCVVIVTGGESFKDVAFHFKLSRLLFSRSTRVF